jgi:predicted nucleic acid binding AN1-type Zn finger protein
MLAINGCRCGHVYCGIHRLPEVHACTALKSLGQEARAQLEQRLVKVEAEKVAGIHG